MCIIYREIGICCSDVFSCSDECLNSLIQTNVPCCPLSGSLGERWNLTVLKKENKKDSQDLSHESSCSLKPVRYIFKSFFFCKSNFSCVSIPQSGSSFSSSSHPPQTDFNFQRQPQQQFCMKGVVSIYSFVQTLFTSSHPRDLLNLA